MPLPRRLGCLVAFALAGAFASPLRAADLPRHDPAVLASQSFLDAHPDLKHRQLGLRAQAVGDFAEAHAQFLRAARFADKPAQGAIAEMLWSGEGLGADRAAAYAWMDLAAERGYRTMVIRRERFWNALTPAERERALVVGESLYADYGDAVAQPRLESRLRRARRHAAGSRLGFTGNVKVELPTAGGTVTIDGASFFHPDYWEPERYWAWAAQGWNDSPRGRVDIGPISTAQQETHP